MKWVVLGSFFVCLATLSRGSALSCQPGSKDVQCISENTEKESTQPSSNVRERKKGRWAECLAGSEWESKCHRCTCSEDGHAECTRMETCEKGDYGDPIRCKPRTSFKNECNTCSCLENGVSVCTLIGCLSALPPLQVQPATSTVKLPSRHQGKECLPGSTWKSYCNSCFCSENGLPACTLMACKGQGNEPGSSCAQDTTWMNDCNRCWCDNGKAACTRMGCEGPIITNFNPSGTKGSVADSEPEINVSLNRKVRATAQGTPKNCQPGLEFRMDCNKCLCDNEGQNYSCTRIDCAAQNNNGNGGARRKRATAQVATQCVPESVFNQGCNVCRCEADGNHATCSIKRCKEDNPDEDADNELSPDSDLSFRCNPGEQFKRGCNDCTCSADGKSVFCTIRLCDQDITPTI